MFPGYIFPSDTHCETAGKNEGYILYVVMEASENNLWHIEMKVVISISAWRKTVPSLYKYKTSQNVYN